MKRKDLKKVMVIGSGPIIIGQAAEFDYSGTQACKALKEEGIEVILVNSNPATIQTDLSTADTVYMEPLNVEILEEIIRKEKPVGLIPTMGGQTGLNLAEQLASKGILKKHGVEILGTPIEAIENGEDRERFKNLMQETGVPLPESMIVKNLSDAKEYVKKLGFPVIIRPAYCLGGTGNSIAFNDEEFREAVNYGLTQSMINQVLIEEAILGQAGWGEIEFEVVRDINDNCITVCSMENVDPMGIHTGESIVVAPVLTLNNHDYQKLRSNAIDIIRALKIEGGCNIQFAFNYDTGEFRVIEVNPRLSRSSALASKATGYPIARVAAKIAIGMTLDEIPNGVTKTTSACFEPSIDYVVVKIPRWPFDKFRSVDTRIGSQMKSTGETMAIGRTFEEAIQKAIRSLEVGRHGLGFDGKDTFIDGEELENVLRTPTHKRLFHIRDAFKAGFTLDRINELTGINKWFLECLKNIFDSSENIRLAPDSVRYAKRLGFSDIQIANILGKSEKDIRSFRIKNNLLPTYKMVDTCAAEFEAVTPYMYSTYEDEDETQPSDKRKVLIIGSGPIRIGQGIEFDYCSVHSVYALEEEGIEALIANNNPETVSTDFDISDKLYFEPLTTEDVLNIIEREKPNGVILQFGGQTSVNMAMPLHKADVNVLGTHPKNMDVAEDRKKFTEILHKLNIPQADYGTAMSTDEALKIANRIGYPVLVRPSYVLGGRSMQIVKDGEELINYVYEAVKVSPEHPVLIDKYLENATELDIDAVADGEDVFVAAIMEHIEEAGIHSGDSSCVIPPQTISPIIKNQVIDYTQKIAKELRIIGLINIQMAIQNNKIFVLEANPRASRTVPYVSKTIGIPLAKIATKVMLGKKLGDFGLGQYKEPSFVTVKEAVFPFLKLLGVNPLLSPEMQSTGEVMGIDSDFGKAFYKAQASANMNLPENGNILLSIARDRDKDVFIPVARELEELGFRIYCTEGTQKHLMKNDIKALDVPKVRDDPKILDMTKKGKLDLIIILPRGSRIGSDGSKILRTALEHNIPYTTTLAGTIASVKAIKALKSGSALTHSLEEYYDRFNGKQ